MRKIRHKLSKKVYKKRKFLEKNNKKVNKNHSTASVRKQIQVLRKYKK